jgi:hypothetical protein
MQYVSAAGVKENQKSNGVKWRSAKAAWRERNNGAKALVN